MRDIKFRAWNNKSKEMLDWFCICQSAFNSGETHLMYDVFTAPSFADDCGFVPMQYTGDKDISGKESYEGDIIENENGDKRLIKWVLNGFEMRLLDGSRDKFNNTVWWFKYTIIGNIYETPELLNQNIKQ